MKVYLSSTLCWAYPVNDVFKIAKLFGFDGIEIWAEHVWWYHTNFDSILKAKEDNDMEVSLHASSWDVNISAINEGIQRQSVMEIEKSIYLAAQIGASNITIHPGKETLHNTWTDQHEKMLHNNLKYLAKKAEEQNVILSIEQMENVSKEFINTPTRINNLVDQLPNSISTTFDIAHVPLNEKPEDYYHAMNRINKIHLSDSTHSNYHVPLGSGNIQLDPIIAELTESNLPVVIEGFDHDKSLSRLQANVSYLETTNLLRGIQVANSSN